MSALKFYVQELLQVERDISELKTRKAELEEMILSNMEGRQEILDGIGMIERKKKTRRVKWDHDQLFGRIYSMLPEIEPLKHVDLATGEVREETEAQKGVRVVQQLANPTWRSGALRDYGIDPDEYCEATPDGYTVLVHEGIEAA